MGQKSQLFFELTVNDTLRLFKEIYEIPEKEFNTNKEYFTELFGVCEFIEDNPFKKILVIPKEIANDVLKQIMNLVIFQLKKLEWL